MDYPTNQLRTKDYALCHTNPNNHLNGPQTQPIIQSRMESQKEQIPRYANYSFQYWNTTRNRVRLLNRRNWNQINRYRNEKDFLKNQRNPEIIVLNSYTTGEFTLYSHLRLLYTPFPLRPFSLQQ